MTLIVLAIYIVRLLPSSLFQQPLSFILISEKQDSLAATIASDEQWRFPAPEELPDKYISALLHFEDKRFYQHPGADLLAIARAARLKLQHGKVISGGSTITMQLARMVKQYRARSFKTSVPKRSLLCGWNGISIKAKFCKTTLHLPRLAVISLA